ncbi:MAG: dihydroorotase [Lachnospiraceae bacterium]|nr:dihydroorotase [Lachnospiraceae bacterium]
MKINNIRVIDPASGRDEISDIYIEEGLIVSKSTRSDDIVIDGTGMIAGPGLVDVHVHFRDPGQTEKECIHTGAMAAAAGGFTSVVMMANTVPPIDDPAVVRQVLERAEKEKIHIYTCATVTKEMKGTSLCDYNALIDAGAVGFTDDGKPIVDETVLTEAFRKISKLHVPVSLHEEDPKYIAENGVNSGEAAKALGLTGADRNAEISMIRRDLKIAEATGVILNIQHISTAEGVDLVRDAKKTCKNIHAEATPHHFTLTDSAVEKYNTLAKMNPPLRSEEDREAIWEGLCDGTIDMIATDHAPHTIEEKSRDFASAPSGITGLETSFLLAYNVLYKKGIIDYLKLFELMSLNPARLYGLSTGTLSEGSAADIVIFCPDEKTCYDTSLSRSCNTPFLGMTFEGKIKYTIAGGRIVRSD